MRPTIRLALGTVVAFALLSALIPPRSPTLGPAAAAETLTGPELVRVLQQGGFVLYFRHTTTARDQEDADRIALDRCETQRGLSEEGRQLAREIGAALRALRIPMGRVLTSPFCRCLDTATLAFGRYEKLDLLTYGLRESAERRKELARQLQGLLATPPAPGTNTILVSHNGNLKDATGLWPKAEGDAHVFRPLGPDGFNHVAEVLGTQWAAWARGIKTVP